MKSKRGFTKAPSLKELRPTEREKRLLKALVDWQEQSKSCNLVFGPSIACPKCAMLNNPNNLSCLQCGTRLHAACGKGKER